MGKCEEGRKIYELHILKGVTDRKGFKLFRNEEVI